MAGEPGDAPARTHRSKLRRRLSAVGLAGGVGAAILFSPLIGNVPIPPEIVLAILIHHLSGGLLVADPCAGASVASTTCHAYDLIVWQSRFPEVVLGVGAGAALGLSGGALQGVFRNPLADPFLLGLSSGGTLGAALAVVYQVDIAQQNLVVPLLAFVGALASGLVVLAAGRSRFGSVETLLLAGVALSSFLSSVLSLVLLANPAGSLQVDFWLLGSLGEGSWSQDGIVIGVLLVVGTLIVLHGRDLNLIQLGNDVAQGLGVDARRVRTRVILLTSVATAVAVAFTGIIGFVGLVSPHVIRRLFGPDYRVVLPGAAVVGAGFLLAARDLSLAAVPSSVLPIGIFTSFAGAPFFAYLLFRRRQAVTMGGG